MTEAPQPSSIRRTSGSWSTSRTVLDRLFSHVLERLRTTTAWRPPRCRSPCPTSSLHRYSTEDRSGYQVVAEAVLTRACRPCQPACARSVPYPYKWTSVSIIMLADFAEYQRRLRRGYQTRSGLGSAPARRFGCAPGLHLGGQWEAWRRVGVVHDADRPTRADNGRVASYSMHIDIDLRIDGNWITRILQSA